MTRDSTLPGRHMYSRPLYIYWLLDCSSSMRNGLIDELNRVVRDSIPHFQQSGRSEPSAALLMQAIVFNSGARWSMPQPVYIDAADWHDVKASGSADMGAAFKLVARELESPPMPQRTLKPLLVLVSGSEPTDDWREGLRAIDRTPWGMRATRAAVALGSGADLRVLREFLASPELEVMRDFDPAILAASLRFPTVDVVRRL